MLTQVRNKFIEFFESKNHLKIESSSLVPKNDPTLLFVNSGMAPLKKYFLQEDTPPFTRLVNSQRCLRVGGKHNDLSDVGYTKRHHTFFEMLGNFSFGDYFQEEVIPFAWEFLTSVLKLDKSRLYVTVHPTDEDAYKIWAKIIDPAHIIKLEENVWSMGDIGPYGYCSEIFYDQLTGEGDFSEGDRYLEIWNLVFMRYYADGKPENKDKKQELPKKCIDAGMGLERMVSVLENVKDTYDISFFTDALKFINQDTQTVDSKIFLDHLRSIAFMITEGIVPGSSSRDYILRRLMRRSLKAFFNLRGLDFETTVRGILNLWQKSYEIQWDIDKIYRIFNEEKKQFEAILEKGTQIFEEMYAKSKDFSAQDLFLLHDTYGFTIDISMDLIKIRGGTFDLSGFEVLMEENKDLSRTKSLNIVLPFDKTEFVDEAEIEANIIGFHDDFVILDRTNFYGESGGQVGDVGYIIGSDFKMKITDTRKLNGVFIHKYENEEGVAKEGNVRCVIDNNRRLQIRAHHSATHLLNQALCDLFSQDLKQMGSFVCEDKLRLDFGHNETITQEDIINIEDLVNTWIRENHKVSVEWMSFDTAVEQGAKAYFNYDKQVRTIKMGNRSFELCGGSHVNATGDIGFFKILKVSAISAGVKRIEACCAIAALRRAQKNALQLKEIAQFLSVEEDKILQKLEHASKKKDHKIDIKTKNVKGIEIGFCIAEDIDIEAQMKANNLDMLCVCAQKDEKIGLQLKIKSPEKCNKDAKIIMQELGLLVGSRGCGGRKDFAQTGGKAIANVEMIFDKLIEIIAK